MKISPHDLFTLAVYALRYTMGRSTTAAEDVSQIVLDYWHCLSPENRQYLVDECSDHLKGRRCNDIDRPCYERIAAMPVEVTE